MEKAITVCLIIVGLINVAPLLGLFSASKIESAYQVALSSPDLAILMRHRALLFGIIGGFTLYAAFTPNLQLSALIMASISMVGFALLVWTTTGYNAALGKVLIVDIIGIVFAAIAAVLYIMMRTRSG